jgi:hypothetical protein
MENDCWAVDLSSGWDWVLVWDLDEIWDWDFGLGFWIGILDLLTVRPDCFLFSFRAASFFFLPSFCRRSCRHRFLDLLLYD